MTTKTDPWYAEDVGEIVSGATSLQEVQRRLCGRLVNTTSVEWVRNMAALIAAQWLLMRDDANLTPEQFRRVSAEAMLEVLGATCAMVGGYEKVLERLTLPPAPELTVHKGGKT
jgi:hypothetical protein